MGWVHRSTTRRPPKGFHRTTSCCAVRRCQAIEKASILRTVALLETLQGSQSVKLLVLMFEEILRVDADGFQCMRHKGCSFLFGTKTPKTVVTGASSLCRFGGKRRLAGQGSRARTVDAAQMPHGIRPTIRRTLILPNSDLCPVRFSCKKGKIQLFFVMCILILFLTFCIVQYWLRHSSQVLFVQTWELGGSSFIASWSARAPRTAKC